MKSMLASVFILPIGLAHAQFGDWAPEQINTTICVWNQPRAALVRDKIYIDGGSIWWSPGLQNGTFGPVSNKGEFPPLTTRCLLTVSSNLLVGNFQGIILSYDLSKPFTRDTNVTGLLLDGTLSKARGGKGNANGDAPVYYDGAILANDAEFFLYGGAVFQDNELYDPPPSYETLKYEAYPYGPDKPLWKPGFSSRRLPDGITRYVAYGGAASAPSENKAWYFSGLTAPSRGPFFWNAAASPDVKASVPSDTLITLDMASQLTEKWTNSTLPSHIKGRANPEVVWVPVGEQGILVVLGGAVYPEWAGDAHVSPNETLSEKESPVFMSTVDIYDVANDAWYQQLTKGGPGTRTRGCAVVAPAADRSSFNIYYYGGFDGIHSSKDFYDDVWILSLPSFTWTKISEGKASHARAGHKCFLPYPDQMMVVGGYTPLSGTTLTCLEDGPIALLNTTSGEWMEQYDPAKYGVYGVHQKVQATIGGNSAGHATATAPVPSGWATPALGKLFATSYNFDKMKTYWPYKPSNTTSTESPKQPIPTGQQRKGVPAWVAPILGVVLGLVLMTGSLLAFCIWRRRRASHEGSETSSSREAMPERLYYWVKGHPQRQPTLTSTRSCEDSRADRSSTLKLVSSSETCSSPTTTACHEMENTQLAELDDTSSPVELHDTGLSTADVMWRNAGFTPLLTSFSSRASLRSAVCESPVISSISASASDGTPSTPLHPLRWTSKVSALSSVSAESGEGTNSWPPNGVVSPIGPTSTPITENVAENDDEDADHDVAARASPLKM